MKRIIPLLVGLVILFTGCEEEPEHSTPQELGRTMVTEIQERDVEGFLRLGANIYSLQTLAYVKIKNEEDRALFLQEMELNRVEEGVLVGNVSEWKINNIIGFGKLKKFDWKKIKIHSFEFEKEDSPEGIEMYSGFIKLISNKKRYMFRMHKMIKMLDGRWYIWKVNMGNYWPEKRRRR